ncbi:MAG: PEP-CTERM sorting domain-containing protein [Haliea sp.]|nr:PEP-CTERM sorting domain-containing protein [Haliea sp.]
MSNTAGDNGYYGIGAYGSRTSVTFYSPQALADRAIFHWNVSGIQSTNDLATCNLPGLFNNCASGPLAFLATTNTNLDFNALFDSANNPLNRFGPGYTYDIGGMPLNQTISLMYWTSAFVTLNANQTTQGGSFSKFANCSNTFELANIDLFDANNDLITDWTMTDLATGRPVFNQNGQISAVDVPEPAIITLVGLGLAALRFRRRRTLSS